MMARLTKHVAVRVEALRAYLLEHPGAQTTLLAKHLKMSTKRTQEQLHRLELVGAVESVPGRSHIPSCWWWRHTGAVGEIEAPRIVPLHPSGPRIPLLDFGPLLDALGIFSRVAS